MRTPTIRMAAVLSAAVAMALALMTAGCSAVADPTRYYVLSPSATAPTNPAPAAASSIAVGVGPVLVPRYLDRVQIVTRNANGDVDLSTYHRWAEPLEAGITQVLAENLAVQTGSDRIAIYPWRGVAARALDYQVAVIVTRFDATRGRQVELDARWRLLSRDGKEVALKRSRIMEPVAGDGYEAVVQSMNRVLEILARQIAQEIQVRGPRAAAGS